VSGSRGRFFDRDPIFTIKSRIDFTGKTGIRSEHENRSAIFPERFLIAIVIAMKFLKPVSDFTDRTHLKQDKGSQIPSFRGIPGIFTFTLPGPGFIFRII
jgi:hypothetical protein